MSACSKSNLLIVNDGDILPEDICNNLENNIIIIHETGCSACSVALPRIRIIERELGKTYKYIDLAVPEDRGYLLNQSFTTLHIPTLIADCKVYVGTRTDEVYKSILENA